MDLSRKTPHCLNSRVNIDAKVDYDPAQMIVSPSNESSLHTSP